MWARSKWKKVRSAPSPRLLNIRRMGTDPMSTEINLFASHLSATNWVALVRKWNDVFSRQWPQGCACKHPVPFDVHQLVKQDWSTARDVWQRWLSEEFPWTASTLGGSSQVKVIWTRKSSLNKGWSVPLTTALKMRWSLPTHGRYQMSSSIYQLVARISCI